MSTLPLPAKPPLPAPARVRDARAEAVRFEGVAKSFGDRDAVRDLDLVVPRGAVYGLLGPNGAGKTTSMRMLMGIHAPDAGSVVVLGGRPAAEVKDRIGYLPEERGLYTGMRVLDNLVFFGSLRGLPRPEARRRAEHWLARFGLADAAGRKLSELSKGNQQKVGFAATVLHEPELIVLDEPFSGLDPVNQDLLRRTILELSDSGTTIILSMHLMDEVERLCSRLTLLHRGRTLLAGTLDDVKQRYGSGWVGLEIAGDSTTVEGHPWVLETSGVGRSLEVRLEPGRDPSEFLRDLAARCRVRRFEVRAPSLHAIFVRLVGDAEADPPVPPAASPALERTR